jgi:hypothetical protein
MAHDNLACKKVQKTSHGGTGACFDIFPQVAQMQNALGRRQGSIAGEQVKRTHRNPSYMLVCLEGVHRTDMSTNKSTCIQICTYVCQ